MREPQIFCNTSRRASNLLQVCRESFRSSPVSPWRPHNFCNTVMKASNLSSPLWESQIFYSAAMTASDLLQLCHESLSSSPTLPWEPQIFCNIAMRASDFLQHCY